MKTEKQLPRRTGWHRYLLLPLNLLYMEIVIRMVAGGSFLHVSLLSMVIYTLAVGLLLTALCCLYSPLVNRRMMLGVQFGLSVWYLVQIIYHSFFGKFMILYSIFAGGADQVIASGLVENTLSAIVKCWWAFLVLGLPIVTVALYTRHFRLPRISWKGVLWRSAVAVGAYLAMVGIGLLIPHIREIQQDAFNKEQSVKAFGLLHSEMMDAGCNVLGMGGTGAIESVPTDAPVIPETPEYEANVLDIDFDALAAAEQDEELKQLHSYFAGQSPSYKNEYTGMFSGYNLIQITAEGFSPYAIHPQLTPTLYKMQQQGFQFTNFYTPIWEVSTSDGEYAATTGLLPKSGVWTYHMAGENEVLLPFTMPQQFLHSGVQKVRAYHNHNYAYYHRDVSHSNLGFIYQGIGNGLQLAHPTLWPESDLEMVESTVGEYVGETPFMTYYMTVSGHLEYSFDGNSMAYRNRHLVEHLPYSEAVRAYYACNIELDKAMEKLLADLESAGVADKTVILITPDHYPYGLEDKTQENMYHYFDEIAGHSIDPRFELYKSCLILYSPSMTQPVTVERYCSSLDIIPTLNNLFGFDYDSRLLMGTDVFSDTPSLIVFLDRSWISEKGSYYAQTGEFTLFEGQSVENEQQYVQRMKATVRNKFKVSAQMVEQDYYRLVTQREHYHSK